MSKSSASNLLKTSVQVHIYSPTNIGYHFDFHSEQAVN